MTEFIFDVCIVGAGPAGIILALELSKLRKDFNIILLEFGKLHTVLKNHLDERIEIKNVINHYLPHELGNKCFGGTSSSWGGRCVQYDEIDFIKRKVIEANCTWSLNLFSEIKSYSHIAASYFQCGSGIFDINQLDEFVQSSIIKGFSSNDFIDTVIERWSLPIRFKDQYYHQLINLPNIKILLNCQCHLICSPDENGSIPAIIVKDTLSCQENKIFAKKFILTAGGIESTRLLLKNKNIFQNLYHPPTALGKYYQGHVGGKIAAVQLYGDPKSTEYGFRQEIDGTYIRRRFQLKMNSLLREDLLNTVLWLDNPPYFDPTHRSGAQSLMYLIMLIPFLRENLAPPSVVSSITNRTTNQVGQHIENVLKDFPKSLFIPLLLSIRRYLPARKLPGIFLFNEANTYALYFQSEQIPSKKNRLELASDHESLIIHYSINDQEIESIIKVHDKLALELKNNNCGKLTYFCPKEEIPDLIRSQPHGGIHQIGTTRIADSEADGVVNSNLQVFGTKNLFVCSSSILPTSSQANPTFIVGEFAVRLAHFLAKQNDKETVSIN